MGDDCGCQVKDIGPVKLFLFDRTVIVLDSVRFVPNRKRNLISLDTLDIVDYSIKISDGVVKFIKGLWLVLGLIELMVCICHKALH